MPKIQRTDLPLALRDHLFERMAERMIAVDDLYQLKMWRESEPVAPEGDWYKDFGSFKICGEGKYPKISCFGGKWRQARRYDSLDSFPYCISPYAHGPCSDFLFAALACLKSSTSQFPHPGLFRGVLM